MDKQEKYREGIKGIRYKLVPKSWRQAVEVRTITRRRSPANPMVVDLLQGKTIFAYEDDRKTISFGSLYSTASSNGRILRMYRFDDLDDDIYKGYLIWMEPMPIKKKTA